jgi:hypothetical protein
MSVEEKMSIDERRKYLFTMRKRYVASSKGERGRLLDEMEVVTGMHRKALTRLMHGPLVRKGRVGQRGNTYGAEVDEALRIIAESLDYVCAERLQPRLAWMAEHLAAHGELEITPELWEALAHISVSTVRRHLKHGRRDRPRAPRRLPHAANPALRDIPMRRIPWNEPQPGHLEADLVHHCGVSASGEYVHTLQLIDVATGWSERAALLGRSYLAMQAAFELCLARLPFDIHELHPDNGAEFFNQHLRRFFQDKVVGVTLSRSRPYHKNDNRNVEQKNSPLVRAFLGYDRLDTVAQTLLLNQLYHLMGLYYNLFQPVMHLADKVVSAQPGQPTRIIRRHDTPQTPFDRLCAAGAIAQPERIRLQTLRAQINPRQLRQQIYGLLDQLFTLPCAIPGVTEDVHHTLCIPPNLPKGEDALVTLSFDRTTTPQ